MSAPTLEDIESINPAARGVVLRGDITEPANWRAAKPLDDWLKGHNLPRHLRRRHAARSRGASATAARRTASWSMRPTASSTFPSCARPRSDWPGLDGMDLAVEVTTKQTLQLGRDHAGRWARATASSTKPTLPCRRRRLRRQAQHPALPRQHRLQGHGRAGDGHGRGHPAPQARRRVPVERPGRSGGDRRATPCRRSRACSTSSVPVFGICLGHQMLALALGGKTREDGARPSRRQPAGQGPDHRQGRDHLAEPRLLRRCRNRCPTNVEVTHVSLFDGTNEGICAAPTSRPSRCSTIPRPRPGPTDSHYLFDRFVEMIDKSKAPSEPFECPSAPTSSASWSSAPGRSSSARPASSTIPACRPARR